MKIYFLLILFVMCGFTSGCLNFIPNNSGNIPSNSVKTSLDATAKIKAEEVFDKYFTKCGDYYYILKPNKNESFRKFYYQYSQVTAGVSSNNDIFTDADIRNGLEWSGSVSYLAVSMRNIGETENEPSKWISLSNGKVFFGDIFAVGLSKNKNSEWKSLACETEPIFGCQEHHQVKDFKKPECSQIPQALLK
jgi:hypothetical protein